LVRTILVIIVITYKLFTKYVQSESRTCWN